VYDKENSFFIIPGLLVWLAGMYDAYTTAKKMNSGKLQIKQSNMILMVVFIVIGFFVMVGAVMWGLATINGYGYYILFGIHRLTSFGWAVSP